MGKNEVEICNLPSLKDWTDRLKSKSEYNQFISYNPEENKYWETEAFIVDSSPTDHGLHASLQFRVRKIVMGVRTKVKDSEPVLLLIPDPKDIGTTWSLHDQQVRIDIGSAPFYPHLTLTLKRVHINKYKMPSYRRCTNPCENL